MPEINYWKTRASKERQLKNFYSANNHWAPAMMLLAAGMNSHYNKTIDTTIGSELLTLMALKGSEAQNQAQSRNLAVSAS